MSLYHERSRLVEQDPEEDTRRHGIRDPPSPSLIKCYFRLKAYSGSHVSVLLGDHGTQHIHSRSSENLNCPNCRSPSASPPGTLRRSRSLDHLLEPLREMLKVSDHKGGDIFKSSLETLCGNQSEEIGEFRQNPMAEDLQQDNDEDESILSSSILSSSFSLSESEETDSQESESTASACSSESDPSEKRKPPVPRKPENFLRKNQLHAGVVQDEGEYMTMNGFRTAQMTNQNHRSTGNGRIPRHVLEEVQATLGFRQDVKGEFKRVKKFLKPFKAKDGYYILWKFSDSVISLSVTFLQDIKNFAVCYDTDTQKWMILKDGPRTNSLSTLLQYYIKKKIKLPLGRRTPNPRKDSLPLPGSQLSVPDDSDTPPPLPPRRRSLPSLPPRPQHGFLILVKPVIQPLDAGMFQTHL